MSAVMITGADGYLGERLARRYAAAGAPLVLWVRAADEAEFEGKRRRLAGSIGAAAGQVRFHRGDLRAEDPFATVDPRDVESIVHAAAAVRFNIPREVGEQVNVEGTRKVLRFAERCPALRAVGLVSSLYASGLQAGPIEEARLDGRAGFANHYEWSKHGAECVLQDEFGDLPWRVFRVATVVADDESGSVARQNAVHNTLKLLYHGLVSVVPGNPATPLYLVTGELVVEAIVALMRHPADRAIYHVAPRRPETVSLQELLEAAFATFGRVPAFARRRILPPVYGDAGAFALLVEGAASFAGGVVNQALASIAPFAPQLFIDKDVRNGRLLGAVPAWRAPDARGLVRRMLESLVGNNWARGSA